MRILLLLFAFITTTAQAQFINTFLPISIPNLSKVERFYITIDTACSHIYSRSWIEPRPRKCMKCGEPEKDSAIRMPGTYSLIDPLIPIGYPPIYSPIYEWPKSYYPIQIDTATYWPVTDSVFRLPVTDSIFRLHFDTTSLIRFYKITDSIPLAPKEPTTWINIDSNRLIAQAFDTNHKETGYISYYKQSDRYTTRGSVKQAVKALYAFTLREIDFASVYMLFVDAINDDGTIKDQALYYRAVQQMRVIRQRYGL